MRKVIAVAVAAGFLGLSAAPAFAIIPFLVPVLLAKKDPNFKSVNPYAKKVTHHGKHHHAKKM